MDTRRKLIQEFQLLWESKTSEIPEIIERDKFECYLDYGAFLDEREEEDIDSLKQYLEPFLFQYELALQWLAYLHIGLDEATENGHEWIGIPNLLIGNAHVYGAAIRKLVLSGFDSPARALLRTFIETLDVIIVFLNEPDIAKEWAANCNDSQGATRFWSKNLRAKDLHKKLKEIDSRYNIPKDISDSFFGWRRSLKNDHSQAVHPNPAATFFTMNPAVASEDELFSSGLFGKGTRFSVRTLRDGTRFTFYFSLLSLRIIADSSKGNPLPSISNEVRDSIIIGKNVFQTLMERHWDK